MIGQQYWNERPCNIRHSSFPVGTEQFFDQVSARRYFVEHHIKEFMGDNRNKTVLEIGCGIGTDAHEFIKQGANYFGIDSSEESIRIAKLRNPEGMFICGNAEEILFQNTSFDLIYSFGVIHHTENPDLILQNIRKVSDPYTRIKIMLYSRYSIKYFWLQLKYGSTALKYTEAQANCPISRVYSKSEILKLFKRNGLKVTKIKKDFIFPYKVEDYIRYKYTKKWYYRFLPKFVFRSLERTFGWNWIIECRLEE
jgi:2-polyprenyl-3-methyl-5-hydroxy-6-metoxy-1,4-benzoquinol methylase